MSQDTNDGENGPTIALLAGVIVASVFVAVSLAAFFEPVWRNEISSVKEMLVGLAAIAAALIAYDGVTSKTRHDRLISLKEGLKRKRNLYFKARHLARMIIFRVRDVMSYIKPDPRWPVDRTGSFTIEHFIVTPPDQLNELWECLGEFPAEVSDEIRRLTSAFEMAASEIKRIELEMKNMAKKQDGPLQFEEITRVKNYYSVLSTIKESSILIDELLAKETDSTFRFLSSEERNEIIQTSRLF
jgi:hypothetical protein